MSNINEIVTIALGVMGGIGGILIIIMMIVAIADKSSRK